MKDMLMPARPPSVRPAPVEIDRLVARTANLLGSTRHSRMSAWKCRANHKSCCRSFSESSRQRSKLHGRGTIQFPVTAVDSSARSLQRCRPASPEILEKISAVLHDQVAWIGAGPSDGEASRRGAPRADWHHLPAGRRHDRHHQSASHRASGVSVAAGTMGPTLEKSGER